MCDNIKDKMDIVKFEPHLTNSFIVCLLGVDYFLVSGFEESPEKPSLFRRIFGRKGKVKIKLTAAFAPSTQQQIEDWINPRNVLEMFKTRNMFFELLSPRGQTLSKVEYTGMRVEKVSYPTYSHKLSQTCEFELEISFKNKKFYY